MFGPSSKTLLVVAGAVMPFTAAPSVAVGQEAGSAQLPQTSPSDQSGPSQIEDVQVLGARPAQADRIDRRVYNVAQDELAQSSTALEVIGRLPSVTVSTSGAITLLGQGSASILIDGKPAANTESLRALLGSDLDRVEVMTNPSSEFRAQGTGGVVNIITRRRRPIGLSGNILGSADSQENLRLTLSSSAMIDRWTLTANSSVEQSANRQDRRRAREALTPAADDLIEDHGFRQSGRNATLGANATYAHDAERTVTFGGSIGRNRSRSDNFYSRRFTGAATADVDERTTGRAGADTGEANIEVSLRTPDRRTQTKYIASLSSTDFYFEDIYQRSPALAGALNLRSAQARQGSERASASAAFEFDPTEDLVFKGGVSWDVDDQAIERLTDTGSPGDVMTSLSGEQSVFSAYGSMQFSARGWTVLPGFRAERATYAIDGSTLDRPVEADLFPSLHLRRSLSTDWSVNLSYSRRVNRPDLSRLDPRPFFTSATDAAVGSPGLRPEFTDALEARLEFGSGENIASATLYHRVTSDVWQAAYSLGADEVVLQTFINAGDRRNSGVELTARRALSSRLRFTGTANVFQSEQDRMAGFALERDSNTEHSLSLTLSFKPDGSDPMSDTFQWSARYSGGSRGYQSISSSSFQSGVSWRRPLTERLVSVLTVSDIFDTGDQTFDLVTPTFRQRTEVRGLGPQVKWTLVHRFGALQ